MSGGGGNALPPHASSGGQFLLSLLQKPQHHHERPPPPPQPLPPQQHLGQDPAVAAVGLELPFPPSPWPSNGHDHLQPQPHTLSPPFRPNFLGFPPGNRFPGNQLPGNYFPGNQGPFGEDSRRLGFSGVDVRGKAHNLSQQNQQEQKFAFGYLPHEIQNPEGLLNGNSVGNSKLDASKKREIFGNESHSGLDRSRQFNPRVNPNPNSNSNLNSNLNSAAAFRHGNFDSPEQEGRRTGRGKQHNVGNNRSMLPPGFSSNPRGERNWDSGSRIRDLNSNVDKLKYNSGELNSRIASLHENDEKGRKFSLEDSRIRGDRFGDVRLSGQLDHPVPPTGSNLHLASATDNVQSLLDLRRGIVQNEGKGGNRRPEKKTVGRGHPRESDDSLDEWSEQLVESLLDEDESHDKNDKSQHNNNSRVKDSRSDGRGQRMLSQRMRNFKRYMESRTDIAKFNSPFIAIYESLIPAEEEKAKQKQLLTSLEKLVCKEWPEARLYLYGSCANSFGVSKSDIDVCLAMKDADINKSEVLLKLADILKSDNLENVQALTRARVPIVKLMDPVSGISCDICINNVLAVVNTKLLRDYALIDVRLRQLAFIVKHWAKSRGVNVTYQGTLSSYAYVLMCIHFLQQRRPAILPCLQEMETTYSVTVEDIECAFFDQVEKLCDFGSQNRESIAQLVSAFFNYWAYHHNYANDVISVRTGSIISKREKDWTRRIGNDRHLICIEDPFEISHDLGRVVDKHSIKVLREEFERAADIMQHDPNPCVTLFEPYVPS